MGGLDGLSLDAFQAGQRISVESPRFNCPPRECLDAADVFVPGYPGKRFLAFAHSCHEPANLNGIQLMQSGYLCALEKMLNATFELANIPVITLAGLYFGDEIGQMITNRLLPMFRPEVCDSFCATCGFCFQAFALPERSRLICEPNAIAPFANLGVVPRNVPLGTLRTLIGFSFV